MMHKNIKFDTTYTKLPPAQVILFQACIDNETATALKFFSLGVSPLVQDENGTHFLPKDSLGKTVLDYACANENKEIVAALFQKGARLDLSNGWHDSAYGYARDPMMKTFIEDCHYQALSEDFAEKLRSFKISAKDVIKSYIPEKMREKISALLSKVRRNDHVSPK